MQNDANFCNRSLYKVLLGVGQGGSYRGEVGWVMQGWCLPKGRHSEGLHEIQGCCSQKCSGVGWVMQGWGGSCKGGVDHARVGGVDHGGS